MATLATLTVKIIGDVSDYQKKMNDAERTTSKVFNTMKNTGKTLSVAVTAPIVALGVASINSASDLAESQNKVNVVFGESARVINEFTANASRSLGTSRQSALEAAGTFGNLFTAMGIGQETSAEMSTNLLTLAADLSSFNNLDPTEVFEKLRAGLVGEVEPLRTLGVNLSAVTVAQKALELGLAETTEELTPAAKAQAAYALILEQTTNAQGDFARTSEGFANMTRIVKAEFVDLTATIGEYFLPYALQLLQWVESAFAWFSALSEEKKQLIIIILAVVAAIGPLLIIFSTLVTSLTTVAGAIGGMISFALSPLGIILILIAGLVFLLYQAWVNNWGGIRDTLTEIWNSKLKPALIDLWTWIQANLPAALETLRSFWENVLKPGMERVFSWIVSNVFPLIAELFAWLADNLPAAIETLRSFWENVLKPGIERFWSWVQSNVIPRIEELIAWLGENIPAAIETLRSFWEETLLPAMQNVWSWMTAHLFPFLQELANFLDATLGLAVAALALLWETSLKPALETVWAFIQDNVLPVLNDLWDFIANTLAPAIGTFITGTIDWLAAQLSTLAGIVESVTAWFQNLAEAIKGVPKTPVGEPPGNTYRRGGAAMGGFVSAYNAYPVGELGTELFVPSTDGYVVSNSRLRDVLQSLATGNGNGSQIHYNIVTNTKFEPEQTLSEKLRLVTLMTR